MMFPLNLITSFFLISFMTIGLCLGRLRPTIRSIIILCLLPWILYVFIGYWPQLYQYQQIQSLKERVLNVLSNPQALTTLLERRINQDPNDKNAYHILSKIYEQNNREKDLIGLKIRYEALFGEEIDHRETP